MAAKLDIIERLNDPDLYVDAIDDAIEEIENLRLRVAELEAGQQAGKAKVRGFEGTAEKLATIGIL